jgi:hypothetical protein
LLCSQMYSVLAGLYVLFSGSVGHGCDIFSAITRIFYKLDELVHTNRYQLVDVHPAFRLCSIELHWSTTGDIPCPTGRHHHRIHHVDISRCFGWRPEFKHHAACPEKWIALNCPVRTLGHLCLRSIGECLYLQGLVLRGVWLQLPGGSLLLAQGSVNQVLHQRRSLRSSRCCVCAHFTMATWCAYPIPGTFTFCAKGHPKSNSPSVGPVHLVSSSRLSSRILLIGN